MQFIHNLFFVFLKPNADQLEVVHLAHAYQITSEHHQTADQNVSLILIVHQINRVSLNVVEIHAKDLAVLIRVNNFIQYNNMFAVYFEKKN